MRIASLILLLVCCSTGFGQKCLDDVQEVEPSLSAQIRRQFEVKLAEASQNLEKTPSADNLIWVGRRTAYLGGYKKAIKLFTQGIEKYPRDARFLRHRGHRYITLRCFDLAVADFKRAAQLTQGKPDEIEPDGLPNERNIPTSTLQSNIWYHLGLAYYLIGNFTEALKAYREAEKVSDNPDMLVATTHWLYMTLRRLGREKEAATTIARIKPNLDVIENGDYYELIRLYQGVIKPDELLKEIGATASTLSNASVGYGLGNWFLYNGQRQEAKKIFSQIVGGNQWASFGYIAAEVELKQ